MKRSNNTTIKKYELGHVKQTHDLVVKYEDRQIYRVRDKSHTLRSGTINIESLNETIVAACRIRAFGRGRRIFSGDPDHKQSGEWIDLQNKSGSFFFKFDDRTCAWTTQGKNDYVLRVETNDQPIMIFEDNSKSLDNPRPTINVLVDMDRKLEQLCLAALFSLAKRDKGSLDNMTRLAMGGAAGGIMITGGAGGGGG